MNKQLLIIVLSLVLPLVAQASRIAITDSGTDFSHEWLKDKVLINENEIAGNLVDDDRNGKVDDVVGWNFVDNYGQVFFPEHLQLVKPDTFTYFEVIARIQAGTATAEDKKFWDEHVTNLSPEDKQALRDRLNFYGEYAHSTHCSGIIASQAKDGKIMSNRVFPDTPPDTLDAASRGPMDLVYKILAAMSNGIFAQVSPYLKERKIDVANYSLGVSLQTIAKLVLAAKGIKNPTAAQLSTETKRIEAQFEPQGRAWMSASPETLFVIAAGNDGTNNDDIPAFPANVKVANSITVAATLNNKSLADFSNYGKTSVDVAAPGVAIVSSVPSLDHHQLLPLSGTSMAAPYVTGVAAQLKDVNSKLRAADLKTILVSTVDHKAWLENKVLSGGIVNPARASMAAELSKTMDLQSAIRLARERVGDQPQLTESVTEFNHTTPEMLDFANKLVF